jgi:hypothetical protein
MEGRAVSSNAFGAIEREQIRSDALRDQAKTERESERSTRGTTDPRQLVADLRSRINLLYAWHLGTESYERRLCAEEIENLLSQCRALETVNCEQGKLMNIVITQRDELLTILRQVRTDMDSQDSMFEWWSVIDAALEKVQP